MGSRQFPRGLLNCVSTHLYGERLDQSYAGQPAADSTAGTKDRTTYQEKKTARVLRAESYRPSAEVRRMYQENSFSGQAPAKAAIDLIAIDTVPHAGTESQKEYLTRLFLEGVEQRLLHKGSGAHGSPVRAHRILCGVTLEQLAEISGYSGADILLIERGIQKLSRLRI